MLDEQRLSDNTILIFMTDNGGTVGVPVFNAGMRGHKMELYDGGHRVPCFIRWPAANLGSPRDIGELTEAQDLLPTLIDLCGLKVPAGAALRRHQPGSAAARPGKVRFPTACWSCNTATSHQTRCPTKGTRPSSGTSGGWSARRNCTTSPPIRARPQTWRPNIPTCLEKMREHYDSWWAEIEPKINELGAITIGSDRRESHQALAGRLGRFVSRPVGANPQWRERSSAVGT